MDIHDAPLLPPEESDTPTLVLPEIFPTASEVHNMLLDAVRVCVGNNLLSPVTDRVGTVLPGRGDIFNDSILYKEIGLTGATDMLCGRIPAQQLIGKILHDDEVILSHRGANQNNIVNKDSMRNTRVSYSDAGGLQVRHVMPTSATLLRYLRPLDIDTYTDELESTTSVVWSIPSSDDDMLALTYISSELHNVLSIYFKLLTRFPSCQSLLNSLPSFRNS